MTIAIVGTGYVGLVTGACFAELGIKVICVDTDIEKVKKLQAGIIPIYEPGLDVLVTRNVDAGRLYFCTELERVINDVDIVFSAVGTPPDDNGGADLRYVFEVAKTIGRAMDKYVLVVTKSTVPVGTAAKVREIIAAELRARGREDLEFDVASNPEFLKEGNAIDDFLKPDRVVIGVSSERAKEFMTALYKPMLVNNFRVIFMDIASAEMTKYAANAMLATRISFMNDIANLCEKVGADVTKVRAGISSDTRIGGKFLYSGCGYGGSCFPKDVKALVHLGMEHNSPMRVVEAVDFVNELQKSVVFNKLLDVFCGALRGKIIALLGVAFKPDTDDMREAPALVVIDKLLKAGATVKVYDPIAMDECKRRIGDSVTYCTDMYSVLDGADAMVLLTEWRQFRIPDWACVREKMHGNVIIDGRNIYNMEDVKHEGFEYIGIGRGK